MGAEARLLKLEDKLTTLGFNETLRAIDLMKTEMSAERGFKRHDGSDYYYHLFDVTLILVNAGIKDEPVLTASVNHDFAEDVQGITIETIKHMFGQEVADTIKPLTKVKGINYKDINNLKAYYGLLSEGNVETPILENWRSSVVKAADIMHNMSTLKDASREKKKRKITEAREVYIPFLRAARNKYPRFASFFYIVRFFVEPIVEGLETLEERYVTEDNLLVEIKELKELSGNIEKIRPYSDQFIEKMN